MFLIELINFTILGEKNFPVVFKAQDRKMFNRYNKNIYDGFFRFFLQT